ncbi:MAG: SagB/ThcOx family dehydrogenase [Dehalococcoidia bacterium]|nr:MAG: SagB/ThcOx family dehydrogenase [Dehalococcoidia bacterium]
MSIIRAAMIKIPLSRDLDIEGVALEKAIASRRSERRFSGKKMSVVELSHILYYTCGITDRRDGLRAAPSAGATYPIEVYPVISNVEDLTIGVYHYAVADHQLEVVKEGDFRRDMVRAAVGQSFLREANAVLVLSAIFYRTQRRYGERGNRYILIEAGHIAQNACLIACSMGLGSCVVGAFDDTAFNRLVGADGKNESVLYLVAVGRI